MDVLTSPYMIIILLIIASGGLILLYFLKFYPPEEPEEDSGTSLSLKEEPDLEREEVDPSSMPVNRWEELARDCLEKGDYRLAIRAFYLSCLSYLADNQLVEVEKYKSNLAYQRELERRLQGSNGRMKAFRENVRIFERIWYGLREATESQVNVVKANKQIITGAGNEQ